MNRPFASGAKGIGAVLRAVLLCVTGCSTHYQPRVGPRLSVVMDGGSLAYYRNGETIKHGFLGGGLVDAVQDDPAAREAAETYHGRVVGSFVAQVAGLACFLGGSIWALSSDSSSSDGYFNTERGAIFVGALGCLLAGAVAGSVLALSAQPYHWDAINIYNDNAEARAYRFAPPAMPGAVMPLPPPPPAATAPASPATTAPPPPGSAPLPSQAP